MGEKYAAALDKLIDARDEIARLRAALAEAREVVACICINAVIQPDAAMGGATDCYAVPVDDIARARALIDRGA